MSAQIISGKAVAEEIRREIGAEVAAAVAAGRRPPGLHVIIVGNNPASRSYVTAKGRAAEEAGFVSAVHELPADVSREALLALIDQLMDDPAVDGLLCQLPLPPHLDEMEVTLRIRPEKDVDGFHPINVGRLAMGLDGFVSCTPLGIRELLIRSGVETAGRRAVVVGRSNIVGAPMAALLMRKGPGGDATVTICHSRTRDLAEETRRADILIAAIGRPRVIRGDMIKPGAVVIDVGVNRVEDAAAKSGFRLVGDVDFEEASRVASLITPVPGGVGPMTIAMLLRNTLDGWRARLGPLGSKGPH